MIGLKRGTVQLYPHDKEWEEAAKQTISDLKRIFGDAANDIQHVGSTSIIHIKAKPIIDIAVSVDSLDKVLELVPALEREGFHYRPDSMPDSQMLFACGSAYEEEGKCEAFLEMPSDDMSAEPSGEAGDTLIVGGDIQTHFIHVVPKSSMEWIDYINFRDYMNTFPEKAKDYEALKVELAEKYPDKRSAYIDGKAEFIQYALRKALVWSYLGKSITVTIDRPIGTEHPKHAGLIYPINYGYIEGVVGGDGEELDVYVLGIKEPVKTCSVKVIGIAHRKNDVEDKLIAAPEGLQVSLEAMAEAVHFQEQYYQTEIEAYCHYDAEI